MFYTFLFSNVTSSPIHQIHKMSLLMKAVMHWSASEKPERWVSGEGWAFQFMRIKGIDRSDVPLEMDGIMSEMNVFWVLNVLIWGCWCDSLGWSCEVELAALIFKKNFFYNRLIVIFSFLVQTKEHVSLLWDVLWPFYSYYVCLIHCKQCPVMYIQLQFSE